MVLHAPRLVDEQITSFAREGFLVVRDAFDRDEIAAVAAWSDELAVRPEEPGKHWVYHEKSRLEPGVDLISRIENIAPFHDGFAELTEALRGSVGQLLGEEAVLFKEKINFKMPGGDGFKPHQDSQAGWERYAGLFITVAVCIDEATLENGCLQLVAGHHRGGRFREWEPLSEGELAGMEFVPYPTRPGDLIYIDSYAPHASEPNLTNRIRRMYFATYNRRSEGDHLAAYYADKHQSYPPDIDRLQGREYVFRV
jgi:ectoine hydroxylase-related dioxygenase (phytanoyl-CoA dioxygenase family)